jgi:hypothetical protein
MNKGIMLRAGLILGTFLIIILVAIGCEVFDGEAETAQLSDPNSVFVTVDGMEITNQELWEVMKNVDGLDYLNEYVEGVLLADYVDAVTQDEIDAEIRLLTYLTEDEDVIAEIMADEEIHQDYLDAFRQNVEVLGFDADDADSLRDFVGLSLAKRSYTKDQIINAEVEDDLYVLPTKFVEYYDQTTFGNVCTLDIRFQNTLEMDAVFTEFEYVLNYENGIGEYIGTEDISTLAKGDFDDTNTVVMSDSAVWSAYVEIYNYMNPWGPLLPTDITQEDYCANYSDLAVKNYDDLVKYKSASDPNVLFAEYIYKDLDLDDEEKTPYTYTTNRVFGDYIMMVFKVSQEEVAAFADITAQEEADLKDELYETLLTDDVINATIATLKEDKGFEIFDPLFNLKNEFQTGVAFENNGSKTALAVIDGTEVTPDELFDYMVDRIGTFYSLEVAKIKVLLNSDAYTTLYGDSYDYLNSSNDNMVEHRNSLREMKSIFSSNGYSTYGYSSSAMTWDEFIYLAFGVEGEAKLIETMFVVSDLQYEFAFDRIVYETGVDYMQDKIDNYFSLNVSHILIYMDKDMDFVPDDFSDYVDGLTPEELTEYNAVKLAFEQKLAEKFNDGATLQNIVDDYTKSLIGDTESDWYEFKNYGFFIMTEPLGEIDHLTVGNLDDDFGAALKRIYNSYSSPDFNEDASYTDDQVVVTDFGIHLIQVTPGTNFDMKTAEFEFTTENTGDYTDGSENDSMLPSKAQVEIYIDIQRQVNAGENPDKILPANVTQAIEYYFGPIYDSYMSQTGFSIAMGEYLIGEGVVYANNNTESLAELQNLIDVFAEVNFPELFDADAQ